MHGSRRGIRGWAALGLLAAFLASDGALAQGDSCRQWEGEHRDWTVRVVRLYLTGGGRHELDTALFELLQREAYLTSCDTSVARARGTFVGWRLANRTPDEYAALVVETLLGRAGFPPRLRDHFGADASAPALALRAPGHPDATAAQE